MTMSSVSDSPDMIEEAVVGLSLDVQRLSTASGTVRLAATGWEPQLHSHLRGALHAGCTPASVEEALDVGLKTTEDEDWRAGARSLWRRVREREPARFERGQEI